MSAMLPSKHLSLSDEAQTDLRACSQWRHWPEQSNALALARGLGTFQTHRKKIVTSS